MANKFPDWHRPDLSERMLVGEEKRLAPRGLFPEQVRADLIQLGALRGGDSMAQCIRSLSTALGIDATTIANFLRGRQPVYGPLLDAIYGPEPSGDVQDDEFTWPDDWGPMLPDAVAAGLVTADGLATDELAESGAGGVFLTVDPAPPAAAAEILPPDTAAALPVVAETTISAPELGDTSCAGDAATTGLCDLNSPRAADEAGQDGEGTLREGSTILTGQSGHTWPLQREAAGEGTASPPPPPEIPVTLQLVHDPETEPNWPFGPAIDAVFEELLVAGNTERAMATAVEEARAAHAAAVARREQLVIAHDTLMGIARAWLSRQAGAERHAA